MNQVSKEVENFLDRLDGVKQTSTGWQARCPCRNDDQNPSLVVSQGNDGRVLVKCHRGNSCSAEEICKAVGLRLSDLMPDKPYVPEGGKKESLALVKTYDYVDENGNLLFQKLRYVDQDGKKTFKQRRPIAKNQWVYSLGDTPKVLYNLPSVLKAVNEGLPIFLVEGEKDADTLTKMGLIATTPPGGAGKWLDIHTDALRGGIVEVIADRDEVGKAHALEVAKKLRSADCDVRVWVSPVAKDITDHIVLGKSVDDLVPLKDAVEHEEEQSIEEIKLSPEEEALDRIQKLLAREDMTTKQKVMKVNSLIGEALSEPVVHQGRLVNWGEFLEETDDETYDWVIPGLLERGERVIVVAAEGVGKTMLARQVAILSACGVHPFTLQDMKPITTLTVDLENPEKIIRRTSRQIYMNAKHRGKIAKPNIHLFTQPSGLDLLKQSDRSWLEKQIEEVQPEILVMGPLYKSFIDPGGRTSEAIAVEVAKYLDSLRTIYNCSLWLEHHAPLGTSMTTRDLRPFGSAVWSRWPEFGVSLTPDLTSSTPYVYDMKHFRGARDERNWPTKITRGKVFPFQVMEFSRPTI